MEPGAQSLDLADRIRHKTDRENYKKVKVSIHYLIGMQENGPAIREQYR